MRLSEPNAPTDEPQLDLLCAALADPTAAVLLECIADGLLILDHTAALKATNRAARTLLDSDGPAAVLGPSVTAAAAAGSLHDLRRGDDLTSLRDGRSLLRSVRLHRDQHGNARLAVVILRDLQLLEHQRRNALGERDLNVFQFLADRAIGPDYARQRLLSRDIERAITHGSRALHQGARLLLYGESGSGKTELARYLHRTVGDPAAPFVHVNCGAIPESLFESEMFGYEKGAFTGALPGGKTGLIEAARGGTLFLDEVAEIPLPQQAKLLKFLEDGEVQRIGGRAGERVSTRIVSATNRDLWQLVQLGGFRQDLYYRLAVVSLPLAPLRANRALIAHLLEHFLAAANRVRTPPLVLDEACRTALLVYDYPGNVRELHNLVQHLSVVAAREARREHLPAQVLTPATACAADAAPARSVEAGADAPQALRERVRAFERELIERTIAELGSKRKAARALGVDIGTIVRKTR